MNNYNKHIIITCTNYSITHIILKTINFNLYLIRIVITIFSFLRELRNKIISFLEILLSLRLFN